MMLSVSPTPRVALATALALAGLCLGLFGDPARAEAAAASGDRCDALPKTLSPEGSGAKSYTMILRINQPENVTEYAKKIRKQVRDQDIFLVNTRFKGSTPEVWAEIVHRITSDFPCNRIIALNGLHTDPTRRGYSYALANDPSVWGISLDWELMDWAQAQSIHRSTPSWTEDFATSRDRISRRLHRVGEFSAEQVGEPGLRTGIVPAWYSGWDYGMLGKTTDQTNFTRKTDRRGFQIVQSQGFCSNSDQAGYGSAMQGLLDQYFPPPKIKKIRNKKGKVIRKKKIHIPPRGVAEALAGEISFSTTPNENSDMPVKSVSVGTASKCTVVGLKTDVHAYLYWAHPGSVDSLLETPRLCKIRKPCPE
jgi:hypothetical protein